MNHFSFLAAEAQKSELSDQYYDEIVRCFADSSHQWVKSTGRVRNLTASLSFYSMATLLLSSSNSFDSPISLFSGEEIVSDLSNLISFIFDESPCCFVSMQTMFSPLHIFCASPISYQLCFLHLPHSRNLNFPIRPPPKPRMQIGMCQAKHV